MADSPNLAELEQNFISAFEARLGVTATVAPNGFIRVLAKVLAATSFVFYRYTASVHRQLYVSTASFEEVVLNGTALRPLVEWGELIGVGAPKVATRTQFVVRISVNVQGGSLPGGTPIVDTDSGVIYVFQNGASLDSATVDVTVTAVTDQEGGDGAGAYANKSVSDVLYFLNPVEDVEAAVSVVSVTTVGADAETEDEYRQRVVDRFRNRPQGGAYADYRQWALTVPGIVGAWPYTSSTQPGAVVVYVEATPESSGDPDGIPTAPQLSDVYDAIQLDEDGLATRRPAGALVQVRPITRRVFNVVVEDIEDVSDLALTRTEITEALTSYFLDKEDYIKGLYYPVRRDVVTAAAIGGIIQDIVESYGGVFKSVAVFALGLAGLVGEDPEGGVEITKYRIAEGEKAKLGEIQWT